MSKLTNVLLVSAVALSLAACDTPPVKPTAPVAAREPVPDCVFSGTNDRAPDWVCGTPPEGVQVSAVGIAEMNDAGEGFAKQMAAADARLQLAQQMKVQVAGMVKKYTETTGAGASLTVDQVNTAVTKQITNESLIGSRIFKARVGTNNKMYVLVGLDPLSTAHVAEVAIKTSMNNERALWQKFQAGKSQDEMAAAIAAQKVEAQAAGQDASAHH